MRAPTHKYDPVGACIYCDATRYSMDRARLGDEHIVPLSLNGRTILPRASCQKCEGRTGGLEQQLFGKEGTYRAARAHAKARSRSGSPERVYATLPLFLDDRGNSVRLDMPVGYAPTFVFEIRLPRAGRLCGRGPDFPEGQVSLTIHQLNQQARFPLNQGVSGPSIRLANTLRLPAKIAHAYATAELGRDAFRPFLREYILEKNPGDAPWDLIGGRDYQPTDSDYRLDLRFEEVAGDKLVVVDVELLPQLKMPLFEVLVGQIV